MTTLQLCQQQEIVVCSLVLETQVDVLSTATLPDCHTDDILWTPTWPYASTPSHISNKSKVRKVTLHANVCGTLGPCFDTRWLSGCHSHCGTEFCQTLQICSGVSHQLSQPSFCYQGSLKELIQIWHPACHLTMFLAGLHLYDIEGKTYQLSLQQQLVLETLR